MVRECLNWYFDTNRRKKRERESSIVDEMVVWCGRTHIPTPQILTKEGLGVGGRIKICVKNEDAMNCFKC